VPPLALHSPTPLPEQVGGLPARWPAPPLPSYPR